MKKCEFSLLSNNEKTQLHCVAWLPDGPPRAILQIAHGVCSYVSRFEPLAEFLCARGFAVYGHDHLGHGQSVSSPEDRLFFGEEGGWDFVVEDLRAMTNRIHMEHPGLPVFLLGHSMGSFIARCYAIRFQDGIDGLLLSGTGQQPAALLRTGIAVSKFEIKRKGARSRSGMLQNLMFGSYNKGFEPRRTQYDWLSRDTEIVDRYAADPSCGGVTTAGLVRDMLGGMVYMSKPQNIARMNKALPVLFFAGNEDPVGEKGAGVIRAYNAFLNAGMEDVTLKLYTGGRHEMLNETNREQVRQDVLDWMEAKLSATARTPVMPSAEG